MSGIPSRFKSEMESHMSAEVKREREEEENNLTPRSRRRNVARKAKAKAVISDVDEVKAEDVEVKKEVVVIMEELDDAENEEASNKAEEDMEGKVQGDVGVPDTTIKMEKDGNEGEAVKVNEEVEEGLRKEERGKKIANTTSGMMELVMRGFGGRGGWRRITANQRALIIAIEAISEMRDVRGMGVNDDMGRVSVSWAKVQARRSRLVMRYPTSKVIAIIEKLDHVEDMAFANFDRLFEMPGLDLFGFDQNAEYVDDEEEEGWEEAENEVEDLLVVFEEE